MVDKSKLAIKYLSVLFKYKRYLFQDEYEMTFYMPELYVLDDLLGSENYFNLRYVTELKFRGPDAS